MLKITLILILIALNVEIKSQTFDLLDSNSFEKYKTTVKYDKLVRIKLKNFNPFLYKAEVKVSQNSFNTEAPALFKKHLIDLTSLPLGGTQSDEDNILNNNYKSFMEKYNAYLDRTKLYRNLIYLVYTDGKSFDEIKREKDQYIIQGGYSEETVRDNTLNVVYDLIKKYDEFMSAYNLSVDSVKKAHLTQATEITSYKKKLDDADFQDLPNDLGRVIEGIDENNFIFTSSPVIAKKDELDYTISVKPISDENTKKFGTGSRNLDFNYQVNITGMWKIDFSTGVFLTSLINHDYISIDSSKIDTTYTKGVWVVENTANKSQIGLMALAHIYYKCNTYLNVGLNFGVGVVQNQNGCLLYGISLLAGNKQRFIFNVGRAVGPVNRLSPQLTPNGFYKALPFSGSLTVKETQNELYFGISYNLF